MPSTRSPPIRTIPELAGARIAGTVSGKPPYVVEQCEPAQHPACPGMWSGFSHGAPEPGLAETDASAAEGRP